jgi:hypothetical protein
MRDTLGDGLPFQRWAFSPEPDQTLATGTLPSSPENAGIRKKAITGLWP